MLSAFRHLLCSKFAIQHNRVVPICVISVTSMILHLFVGEFTVSASFTAQERFRQAHVKHIHILPKYTYEGIVNIFLLPMACSVILMTNFLGVNMLSINPSLQLLIHLHVEICTFKSTKCMGAEYKLLTIVISKGNIFFQFHAYLKKN